MDPELIQMFVFALIAYDPSSTIKASLSTKMFPAVLRTMGAVRLSQYADDAEHGIIGGCFALTEISHGSNALGMRTTATYDPKNRQIIIHTPDFEAAKCWIGNLGKFLCNFHLIFHYIYLKTYIQQMNRQNGYACNCLRPIVHA